MSNTPEISTSKFKKFAIPGALVVGGITAGSFLAPIGLASAQESTDADTESTDSTESTEADSTDADSTDEGKFRRGGRHGRANGGERSEVLTETLGLTAEEVRQGFEDGKSLADLATEQGVDVADLQAALVAQASERIDAAVESGRIDADEAAEKLAEAETMIEERINANPEDLQARPGRGGEYSRGGKGNRGGQIGANAEALEEALGLTGEEIRAGLTEGKSLSDLAAEQGVSAEDLAAVLTSGLEERIDAAVEAGKIDAERAAEVKDGIDEKIDSIITREFDGERGDRGEGRRGNRGFRRGAPADSSENNTEGEIVESTFSA